MFLQQPGVPLDAPVDPSTLLGAMVGVVLFSALAAVTRVGAVALVWRLCALACTAIPITQAFSWWFVNDPTGTLSTGNAGALEQLLGRVPALPQLPDLGQIRAPEGLELMALGWALALVGLFLLVLRTGRSPR
jgi:hypothetical protein